MCDAHKPQSLSPNLNKSSILHMSYVWHTPMFVTLDHSWWNESYLKLLLLSFSPLRSTSCMEKWTSNSVIRYMVLCNLQPAKFIGQLPRVSTEDRDRVVSVFELANSLVYPERIQRGKSGLQFLKRSVFLVSKFSHFYTVQYRRVQYSTGIYLVPRYYSVV